MDLALNNLQRLICHKTKQTKPNKPVCLLVYFLNIGPLACGPVSHCWREFLRSKVHIAYLIKIIRKEIKNYLNLLSLEYTFFVFVFWGEFFFFFFFFFTYIDILLLRILETCKQTFFF